MVSRHSIKLIEEIADQIKTKILTGGYRPGERLKQERLAEEFGVSRTPIREALSRLEAQGLVSQPLRRSAVVNKPSLRDVAEIFQIRAELEGLTAGLAAQGISDGDLSRLRSGLDNWQAKLDAPRNGSSRGLSARQKAWRRFEGEFHGFVIASAGNRNLERVIRDLMSGAVGAVVAASASAMADLHMKEHHARHCMIFEALERRDPVDARSAIVADVVATGEYVLEWYRGVFAHEGAAWK